MMLAHIVIAYFAIALLLAAGLCMAHGYSSETTPTDPGDVILILLCACVWGPIVLLIAIIGPFIGIGRLGKLIRQRTM